MSQIVYKNRHDYDLLSPISYRGWRRTFINSCKDTPCIDCGWLLKDRSLMTFDHIPSRGPKKFNVSENRGNMVELIDEIEKCEVVCRRCHDVREDLRRREVFQ